MRKIKWFVPLIQISSSIIWKTKIGSAFLKIKRRGNVFSLILTLSLKNLLTEGRNYYYDMKLTTLSLRDFELPNIYSSSPIR